MTKTELKYKYVILTADYFGDDLNDWLPTGLTTRVAYQTSDETDILKVLIKSDYFMSSASLKDIEIEFEDEDNIYVMDRETGLYICKLMRVGE